MDWQIDIASVLMGIAWLAILVMLAGGVVISGWRVATRPLLDDTPLPFFTALRSRGLTLEQVETAVGIDRLAHAVRRCVFCTLRPECTGQAAECPNQGIFGRAQGLREAR